MNHRITRLIPVSMVVLAAFVGGCATHTHSGANAGLINAKCPMMPNCQKPLSVTTDYSGGKVGFCCKGCLSEWNGLSDAQKSERFAAVKK